ncbi:MAG: integrase core domain-containing protein, partial [Raoultibacter sp.]
NVKMGIIDRLRTDKGAQYTSRLLAEWARDNDVRLSCSRTGNCHDNAVAESFFATLKNEMYYRKSFSTRAEAKMAVINFIECYYKPACSTIRKAA